MKRSGNNDQPGTSKQLKINEFNNNQPCTSRKTSDNKTIDECEVTPTEYEKQNIEYELILLLESFINCFVKRFEAELPIFTVSNQSEEMNNGASNKILPKSDVNKPKLKSANNNYIIENLRKLTLDKRIMLLVNVSGDIFTTFQKEIYRCSRDKNVDMKQLAIESVNRFLQYVNSKNKIESCDINLDKLRYLLTEGIIFGGSETTSVQPKNIIITNGVLSNVRNIFDGARLFKIEKNNYKIETGYSLTYNEYGSALSENHELSDFDSKIINIIHIEPENTLSNDKLNHELNIILYNINMNHPINLKSNFIEHLSKIIKEEYKNIRSQQKNQKNKKSIWFNIKPQVKNFTGRMKELTQIHALLQNKSFQKEVVIQAVVISGIGGIGKSELSRMYIHQYKKYYHNTIWIDSDTEENLKTSFQNLAQELEIEKKTNTDIKIIVKKIYQLIGKSTSLIIFDNAESYEDIKDYLPPSLPTDNEYQKPAILLTSRSNKWKVDKDDGEIQVMELEFFNSKESISFIESTLNEAHSCEDMMKLAEELGFYPLALKQAVGYINVTNDKQIIIKQKPFKICDYLKEFQENNIKLLGFKPENNRYEQTIMAIWNVTFQKISRAEYIDEKIQETSKNSLKIIQIMSYLSPDINDFIELFKQLITDENKLWDSIVLLQQYSLISVDTERDTATIHRLLQLAIKNQLKENDEEIQILENAISLFDFHHNFFYSIEENKYNRYPQQENLLSVLSYGSNYDVIIDNFYKNVYLSDAVTPLFILTKSNNFDAVKKIVKYIKVNKPDELNDVINAVNKDNESILHAAVEHCDLDIIKCLIENGGNINAVDDLNRSILQIAVQYKNLETIKYLRENGAIIKSDNFNKNLLYLL